jgi:hypothetical protein
MSGTKHRIDIEHVTYNTKGMLWRVTHEGRVILEKTHLPALGACRYLLALGRTGNLVMFRDGELQLSVDIVKWAGITVIENRTTGPIFLLYRPFVREEAEQEEQAAPTPIG